MEIDLQDLEAIFEANAIENPDDPPRIVETNLATEYRQICWDPRHPYRATARYEAFSECHRRRHCKPTPIWYARIELNDRPRPYQDRALTN